jgi:hypothetical protein
MDTRIIVPQRTFELVVEVGAYRLGGVRCSVEANHEICWERLHETLQLSRALRDRKADTHPRLCGVVAHVPDLDAGFLPHLALNGVLEGLCRFHETCESRVKLARKFPLRSSGER